jgi:hypothetical protein
MSFIEYLLVQFMVLWKHQMVLEPKSAVLAHREIVDLRITLDQTPLDVGQLLHHYSEQQLFPLSASG